MPKDREYSCSECSYSTNRKQNLREHLLTHTGELPYKCGECGKTFNAKSYLKRHSIVHTNGTCACDICGAEFSRNCNLTRHYQRKHPKRDRSKDTLCQEEEYHAEEEKGVRRQEDGKFHCPLCSFSTISCSSFENHCRIHTGEKPFECPHCKNGFRTNSTLLRHIRSVHTGEQRFRCATCEATFKRRDGLRRHLRRVHGRIQPDLEKADAKDDSVNEAAPSSPTPKDDSQRAPRKKDERYRCPLCSYSCHRTDKFDNHLRFHVGTKPFQCNLCSKAFSANSDLKRHFRTHDEHRPFSCTICDKTFRRKDNLQAHWGTHGLKGPCPVLKRADTREDSNTAARYLKTLLKKRMPLVKHRCPECPYSSHRRYTFDRHLQIHLAERPFQCDLCQEAFVKEVQLVRHVRTHAGCQPFVCGTCDKRFRSIDNLRKHEESHSRKLSKLADIDEGDDAEPASSTTSTSKEDHQKQPTNRKQPAASNRKHRCHQCKYSTNLRSKLEGHLLTHLFAKPFLCDQCGQAFADEELLHSHLCTRDEIVCTICEKGFDGMKEFLKHEKSHLQDSQSS